MGHSAIRTALIVVTGSWLSFACSSSDSKSGDSKGPGPNETFNTGNNTGVSAGGSSSGSPIALPAVGSAGAASGKIVAIEPGVTGPSGADAGALVPQPPPPSVVNPFTIVAHDPLSTFAADVDTASYDQFVRDIGYGHLPAKTTVRTEEFVNYFGYDYPPPAEAATVPFSISLGAAPGVFADGTSTLRVGIQGKLPPPFEKKPTNLVFLVDVSGSMQSPEKLPLVQFVLTHTLDVLAPMDTISIVTYASGTGVALAPTPAGDRTTIEGAVNGLSAGGSTNGAGGIQLAYEQAQAGFLTGGINHVVLCTDGDFNVGISDTNELVRFITDKRKSGVTLTALGFGSSVNDPMMEAVSNAGNGTYSVITSTSQASRYVEEKLLDAITYIAQDVKIQVEFNPAQVYAYRLMGYEDRAIPDAQFRNDIVDAGEIGAGHRVTALYQVVPSGGTIPVADGAAPIADGVPYAGAREVSADDLVLVKIRYKDVGATETDPAHEVNMALPASAVRGDLAGTDVDMRWAVAVGAFSEILRGSPFAKPAALDTISALIDSSKGSDADRVEFASLFQTARPMIVR